MSQPKVTILFQSDRRCDMESLSVNGSVVGFGNTHDEHCADRLEAIEKTLYLLLIPYEVIIDNDWRYR